MAQSVDNDRARWARLLNATIHDVLSAVPFGSVLEDRSRFVIGFRDEFGNRRASDRPFLAHVLGVQMQSENGLRQIDLDEAIWWCLVEAKPIPDGLVSRSGGLLLNPDDFAIEYRTMVELCALQALWSVALRDKDRDWRERSLSAAIWHIEELQPDNAINRPWGLPVFVELSLSSEDETISQTARLHAETLLHNACINFGKPDLLSALILKHSADLLTRAG